MVGYAPDGSVDRVTEMPVKKVTSVNFSGPNILYVTSMAKPALPRFPLTVDGAAACLTVREGLRSVVSGVGVPARQIEFLPKGPHDE